MNEPFVTADEVEEPVVVEEVDVVVVVQLVFVVLVEVVDEEELPVVLDVD